MAREYKEAQLGKHSIYRADAPFDEALESLSQRAKVLGVKRAKIPSPMPALLADRTQVSKLHSLSQNGSYTSEGFLYAKDSPVVVSRVSPFVRNKRLAREAVNANRGGKYFSTADLEIYEKYSELAEEDKDKEPGKRRAIVLPGRKEFAISPSQNPEAFEFFTGKIRKKVS